MPRGGVGSAVVQLAKARKAGVIGITSQSKSNNVLNLGADRVLLREDRLVQTLGAGSIDVVIDLVGGKWWPELLDVLKTGGRYAVAGAIGGPLVELDIRTLCLKDLSLFGCTVLGKGVFSNLVRRIEHGDIVPVVDKIFPLGEIAEAQKYFETKQHTGKIVLVTDG